MKNDMIIWKIIAVGTATTAALYFAKRYFAGPPCTCFTTLDRKVVVITGANSGIGKEVATELARKGAFIILACRNIVEAERTRREIIAKTGCEGVAFMLLDLNSFQSIRRFAETLNNYLESLYALVNNAGVFYHPKLLTEDGHDVTFQTNYLGPFLLTYLLLDLLKKSGEARIVNVVSEAHRLMPSLRIFGEEKEIEYDPLQQYSISKLCLLLLTRKLSCLLEGTGVTANAVDPGNVETKIYRHFPLLSNPYLWAVQKPIRLLLVKTPWEGAQTVIHAVSAPALTKVSGEYLSNLHPKSPSKIAFCKEIGDQLWNNSLQWCAVDTQ